MNLDSCIPLPINRKHIYPHSHNQDNIFLN